MTSETHISSVFDGLCRAQAQHPASRARGLALLVVSLTLAAIRAGTQEPPQEGASAVTVSQAIELALAHNRTIGMSQEDLHHYKELKAKAHAQYLPTISNASSVNRGDTNQNQEWNAPDGSYSAEEYTHFQDRLCAICGTVDAVLFL